MLENAFQNYYPPFDADVPDGAGTVKRAVTGGAILRAGDRTVTVAGKKVMPGQTARVQLGRDAIEVSGTSFVIGRDYGTDDIDGNLGLVGASGGLR